MISHSPTVQAASEEKCSWSSEQTNCDLPGFLRKRLLKHRPLVAFGDLKAFCWILDQWLLLESSHNILELETTWICCNLFLKRLFCFSKAAPIDRQDANFGWHVETVKTRMAFGAKTRTPGKMTRLQNLQPLLPYFLASKCTSRNLK